MSARTQDTIINQSIETEPGVYYAAESEHGWGVALNGRIILREDGDRDAAEGIARMLNQFVDDEDYLADFPKKQ